jgi:glycosyltransferase involved in cell wall biosynthesis
MTASTARMHIGVDGRLAGIRHGGIGRYTQELLQGLAREPQIKLTVVVRSHAQAREVFGALRDHVRIVIAPVQHYTLTEQFALARLWAGIKPDLVHVPHFNAALLCPVPFVVTIHDLLWHHQHGARHTTLPYWQYGIKHMAYRWLVGRVVRRARALITPSQVVAADLRKTFSHLKTPIFVTPEGVSEYFFRSRRPQPTKPKKGAPFTCLYVGSLYPHKRVDTLLRALKHLPENVQLRCLSARNVFFEQTQHLAQQLGLKHRVTFESQASDVQLLRALEEADCVVQPSSSEGFGLPVLEALAVGTPCIVSDIPIFHEVYQDTVQYVSVGNAKAWAEAIEHAIDTPLRALTQQRKAGQLHAAQFEWKNMVDATLAVYRTTTTNLEKRRN